MLYQLLSGIMLYTDEEPLRELDPAGFIFDAAKTCFLQAVPARNGHAGLQAQRGDKSPWGMRTIRVPLTAVALIFDVHSEEILKLVHEELSGLILPGPGARAN